MEELKACKDAVVWVTALNTDLASEVWDQCQRGDWLLWLAGGLDVDRKLLVSGACACARTSLAHVKDPQDLEITTKALARAEKWTKGEATDEDMKIASAATSAAASAADDAYDAAYAASTAASYAAASAPAYASAAAYAAAYAAYAAAYVAYAASTAASYAAASAARTESLANTAKIVKSIIKWEDINF